MQIIYTDNDNYNDIHNNKNNNIQITRLLYYKIIYYKIIYYYKKSIL